MASEDAFLLFFRGLARNAPGTDEATLRALRCCELPREPVVYDMGAGTGSSALVLAEALQSRVVAVDLLSQSLGELTTRAQRRGIDSLIEARQADILELEVEPGSVDLIWCEGAIYAVGWEAALTTWRPWLGDDGYLVVSEAVWAAGPRAPQAVEFWERGYPQIGTAEDVGTRVRDAGFDVVETFVLEAQGWDDYYDPLRQRTSLVLQSDRADSDVGDVAREVQREIAIRDDYGSSVDYQFFVLRPTPR